MGQRRPQRMRVRRLRQGAAGVNAQTFLFDAPAQSAAVMLESVLAQGLQGAPQGFQYRGIGFGGALARPGPGGKARYGITAGLSRRIITAGFITAGLCAARRRDAGHGLVRPVLLWMVVIADFLAGHFNPG